VERRATKRHSIHLDVIIVDKSFQSWEFTMVDFDVAGLYLSSKQNVPDSIQVNDLLELQFKTDEKKVKQSYSLRIKVLRKLDQTLAIEIYNSPYEALLRISKRQEEQSSFTDSKAKEIYSHLEKQFLSGLSECIETFLSDCNEFLFTSAEKSINNTDQTFFFSALNTLNSCKTELKDEFTSTLLDNLNLRRNELHSKVISNPPSEQEPELRLLRKDEYENQLLVDHMINSSTQLYKQSLFDIDQRLMSLLSIQSEALDTKLFYPDIIFTAFNESVHHYFTDNASPPVLCKEFEKSVNDTLPAVYDDLNQTFIDNGVLVIINKKQLEVNKPAANDDSITNEFRKDNKAQANQTGSAVHSVKTMGAMPAANDTIKSATEITPLENNINLNNAYQSLKEILSFQNRQSISNISSDDMISGKYSQQVDNLFDELTELHQTVLSETPTDIEDLSQLVMTHITKENYSPEVCSELEYTLDIMGRLFGIINQDEWLTPEVKNLIGTLHLPLIKVALVNKDFFASWANPARMLVNKLAMMNFSDMNNDAYLKAKSYIDLIAKNFNRDLSAFSKVQEVLSELLYQQSRQYDASIKKTMAYWEAQQKISWEIAKYLADQPIPASIADFISDQWLHVLVNTYNSQQQGSIRWQQYMQVLQMCVMFDDDTLSEQDKNIKIKTILFIIKKGLSQSGLYNKKIMANLELIFHKPDLEKSVILTQQNIFQLLMNGYALSDKIALEKISLQSSAKNKREIELINKLQINDCLIYRQKTKNLRLQLAWKSDDKSVLVMIGRNGHQEVVLNQAEIISLHEHGEIYQSHHFDLPLLERSLYAVIGDEHCKLTNENKVDPVTKFILRQDFEQILSTRLRDTKNQHFALCMINIDRLSLINNTFGFECGDQYLAALTNLFNKLVSEDTLIARYGVDQFILLIDNQGKDQVNEQAEKFRQSIQNFNFEWQDKSFSLTASIGITLANVKSTSTNKLINAVSTAMSIAKEQGRNRVFFFSENDTGVNYQQQLQIWATKVEQMIERQQLDLSFQRIQPLSPDASPHYEVLLVIKDEEGNPSSPIAFIKAAELYNKMELVDQWVIDRILHWCQQNPSYFKEIGDISINLSGHSLNSIDFVDYVSEKFTLYNINPSRICFEITETVAIANLEGAVNLVQTVKKMGCKFALDDFGTGMSSYAYLKNLPVDYLKIDGIFVKDIANNITDEAIVRSINEIGHFLGKKTIAEYVENSEIIAVLESIGVDYLQGYGIEKPIMMSNFKPELYTRNQQQFLENKTNDLAPKMQ